MSNKRKVIDSENEKNALPYNVAIKQAKKDKTSQSTTNSVPIVDSVKKVNNEEVFYIS